MKPKPWTLAAGAWFGVVILFVVVAVYDQSAGRQVWGHASPLIHFLSQLGVAIALHLIPITILIATAMIVLLIWAILGQLHENSHGQRWIFSGVALAVCGQAALVLQHLEAGTALWIVGVVAITRGALLIRHGISASWVEAAPQQPNIQGSEVLTLFFFILIAALFRFYLLDQIVNYFEGELAPYYAGATSLRGMWLADAGINGSWAPLHLSFYLPVWLTTKIFGTTVLGIRAAAALVSLTSIPLLYAVARRVGGPPAALFATSFFVLDPLQIGWGRSDVHPHASTLWAPLLVCLALLRAIERRRTRDFALLAIAMGVSWQTYPSGQSAVLIPILVFGIAYLVRSPRVHWLGMKPLVSSVTGLLLWTLSIPLPWLIATHHWHFPNLLHQLGNRTSWDSIPLYGTLQTARHVLYLAAVNSWEILSGLFYHVPLLFHQTFLPTPPHFLQRSLNWTALPFSVLGVVLALAIPSLWRARVVVAWAILGAAPSIFSDQGFVKRAATLYPSLLVLAGVGFSILWRWIAPERRNFRRATLIMVSVALAGLFCLQSFLWFSGRYYPPGTPAIEISLRALKPQLRPGTIVVLDAAHPFLPGMATYLLLDTLGDQSRFPVAWVPCADGPAAFPNLLADPPGGLATLPRTPWYTWTKLRPLMTPLMNVKRWRRVVFLFQDLVPQEVQEPKVLADLEATLRRHPEAHVDRLPGPRANYRLKIVTFNLRSGEQQPSKREQRVGQADR